MSKYVLEISKNKYESSPNCEICKVIDEQFKTLSSFSSQEEIKRLELLLVNGYHLNDVLESNNAQIKYKLLNQYPSYHIDIYNKALHKIGEENTIYNTYNALSPTLLFGRWCKNCGSRKHDIYDMTFHSNLSSFTLQYDLDSHILSWKDIQYEFIHYFKIYKKSDISSFKLLKQTTDFTLYDDDLDDGRVYTYLIQVLDMHDEVLAVKHIEVWTPYEDHTPLPINYEYRIHRYLDENHNIIDYLYAKYDVNDSNYGKTIFKLNHDHVPSITYWHDDVYFDEHDRFFFPDDRKYFLKPYIMSKKFKKDGINDHLLHPDKYFWNINSETKIVQYRPFYQDYVYDLVFTPLRRAMQITFKLKWPNDIKQLKLYFKQTDQYLLDTDDTYKVLTITPIPGVVEYTIDINRLASNTHWMFGLFPVYDSKDEDIRMEYQTVALIPPIYDMVKKYQTASAFYDINHWHLHSDFYSYDIRSNNALPSIMDRQHEVWICDKLPHHDVGVLLIHDNDIPECFTLSYDYKFISITKKDRLNMFHNFQLDHKVLPVYDEWAHFEKRYMNQDYAIIRWEVMRHETVSWTCAFLDNITITAHKIIDKYTDNFTYTEELIIKNAYKYNKKIRYNGRYKFAPERIYHMNVVMKPYDEKDLEGGEI